VRPLLLVVCLAGVLLRAAPAAGGDRPPGFDFADPSVVDLQPFETKRPYPSRVELEGVVGEGYRDPEVALIRPDGRALKLERALVRFDPPRLQVEVPLDHGAGVYRLEISASLPGPVTHSAARIRFFAGVGADSADAPEPPDEPTLPGADPTVLEDVLFRLVNEHRRRAKLDELPWLEPLADACREHVAACVKAGKVDHVVDARGNVARRVVRLHGWGETDYASPSGPPDPRTPNHVAAVTDARRSLDLVLYRWERFAAFCIPMTSERYTGAACAVARAQGGLLYVVFAYAQVNQPATAAGIDAGWKSATDALRQAHDGEAEAAALREVGRWRRDAGRRLALRRKSDRDPEVRAAAWDALRLLDLDGARHDLDRSLEALRTAGERDRGTAHALEEADWMGRLRWWPEIVPGVVEAVGALRARADQALAAAEALRAAGDEEGASQALRDVERRYPGTSAAERARSLRTGEG
jgi:Cysteine-rich secretory protein family